jgi:hypothetical protein
MSMRRALACLHLGLLACLLLFAATQVAHWLERLGAPTVALGAETRSGLRASTVERLRSSTERISFTYFASPAERFPARDRHVPGKVRTLLEQLQATAPEMVDVLVLDPDVATAPGDRPFPGHEFAAQKGAAPFKVRRILRDAGSEVTVWSSLVIARGQRPDALLQGLTADDLPWLEDAIAANLDQAVTPRPPVVAIAAPAAGYRSIVELCRRELGATATVIDFDANPNVPAGVDVLLWLAPTRATAAHAAAIERLLATGRSVVVAASTYATESRIDPADPTKTTHAVQRSAIDWRPVLQPFGVDIAPLLLAGAGAETLPRRQGDRVVPVAAPFHLRLPASLLDLRQLQATNSGMLLVGDVSPVQVEPTDVERAGRRAVTVATTADGVRLADLPGEPFTAASLAGLPTNPKQPWLVLLQSISRWRGDLLVCGAPLLFHDDVLAAPNQANQLFLRGLLRTYTTSERLARAAVPRHKAPVVPEASPGARLWWRLLAIALVPLAWLVPLLARRRSARVVARPVGRRWHLLAATVTVLVGLGLLRTLPLPGIDTSAAGVNTPLPQSHALVDAVRDGLVVDFVRSAGSERTGVETRTLRTLRQFGLRPRLLRPESLDAPTLATLRAQGIQPFARERIVDDVRTTGPQWSALRFTRGTTVAVVPRLDERTVDHLEFLIAAACRRLATGTTPVLGVLSDLPRLSPAEAHTDFQEKGLVPPVGSDVFRQAKDLLVDHGYELAHISPDTPAFPSRMDALVWLQPRFAARVWPQFTAFMAAGGKALVALQHYNVQQRQYRGSGFRTVYWPQPQYHGCNDYLQLLGIEQRGDKRGEQAGEILFDRQHAELAMITQVNRGMFREHETQQVALPFLIRAAGSGLASRSVVTRGLGNLVYPWAGRLLVDAKTAEQRGLHIEPLVATSDRTWTYAWSGSWIPDAAMQEPTDPAAFLPGRNLLAVAVTGTFPRVDVRSGERGQPKLEVLPPEPGPARPGALLLNGCSEMWKDALLHAPGAQHDQFLLNAAALLVYGQELAEVQAHGRPARAMPWLDSDVKLAWRCVVLGAPIAMVLVTLGFVRWIRRRSLRPAGGTA